MSAPAWLDKMQTGLLGQPNTYGGILSEQEAKDARQAGLINFGSSLLMSSGPSPMPTGFGASIGQAALAGRAGHQSSIDNALNAALLKKQLTQKDRRDSPFGAINPSNFTPESLAEFQSTNNYGALKPTANSNIGNFNPGDYTPDSFATFMKSGQVNDLRRYVSPAQPTVQVVNGVPTAVQPSRTGGATTQAPLSTLESETEAKSRLAAAAEVGRGAGTAQVEKENKANTADTVSAQLKLADPLIDVATGSGGGAAVDKLASVFGYAPDGAVATAQLKVLEAGLVLNMPHMSGPQSDRDALLYKEAAARIGDPTVPRDIKKAAVKTIRDIQQTYKDAAPKKEAKPSDAVRKYNPATGKIE